MSTLKQFSTTGQVDFVQNGTPNSSVVGARVGHEWCDYSTGTIWTCTDDTFGSQIWQGDDGSEIGAITRFDHPNLIAAYTMDNISGSTVNDESPNNANATATGTVTYAAGKIGNCANTRDLTAYINLPAGVYGTNASQGAVAYWANLSTPGAGGLISFAVSSTNNQYFYVIANDSSGRIQIGVSIASATGRFIRSQFPITSQDVWLFIVAQCDGTQYQIFADGVEVALDVQVGPNDGSMWWDDNTYDEGYIGLLGGSSPSGHTNDLFDQVRIFNRALTSAEISQLYNGGVGA